MLNGVKWLAKVALRKAGYEIRALENSVSFSQIDVFDLLARDINVRKGGDVFVLQVGANDGIRADPLRPILMEFPWRGLLVEPQPDVFEQLVANYAGHDRLDFANVFVTHAATPSTTLFVPRSSHKEDNHRLTGLARFDRESLDREMRQMGFDENDFTIEGINVPSVTVDALLSAREVERVDVVVIDAEGCDYEILKGLDFDRYHPALVMMEFFHLSPDDKADCIAMLEGRGFKMVRVLGDLVAANFCRQA